MGRSCHAVSKTVVHVTFVPWIAPGSVSILRSAFACTPEGGSPGKNAALRIFGGLVRTSVAARIDPRTFSG